jgi:hypothetical protein
VALVLSEGGRGGEDFGEEVVSIISLLTGPLFVIVEVRFSIDFVGLVISEEGEDMECLVGTPSPPKLRYTTNPFESKVFLA